MSGFAFARSKGYGVASLTTSPLSDDGAPVPEPTDAEATVDPPTYFGFTADMIARSGPPQANSPAPDWLFLADLAVQLWYGQLPGQGSAETARIDMPTDMFKRTAFGP